MKTNISSAALCKELSEKPKAGQSLYFIGIGGSGMYGLACLAQDMGFRVCGTDAVENRNTERLRKRGIPVIKGQTKLPSGMDLVVYSLAIDEEHPLLKQAAQSGIPICNRARMQGYLMEQFPVRIAIAGAHGKSSTVGMCAAILERCGKEPTVLIGADLSREEGGYRKGSGEIFLCEACEYRDAFLCFCPTHAAVLNVEWEHIDYFKTPVQTHASFRAFLNGESVKLGIASAACGMDADVLFGTREGFHARGIGEEHGCACFTLFHAERACGDVKMRVVGKHQAENALAAAAICDALGVSHEDICEGLSAYRGIGGRMEYCGMLGASPVYLDYAHHPTELAATLAAAKSLGKRTVCVFEPHTFSRVHAFEKELLALFKSVDRIGLLPIFPARETETHGMSSQKLAAACGGKYLKDFLSAAGFLRENAEKGSVLLLVGAGRVGEVLGYLSLTKG